MIVTKTTEKTQYEGEQVRYILKCTPHDVELILKALDKMQGDDFRQSVDLVTTIRGEL